MSDPGLVDRYLDEMAFGGCVQRFLTLSLSPIRRVSRHLLRFIAANGPPNAPHQPKTIGARPFGACLMLIGRPDPCARLSEDRITANHETASRHSSFGQQPDATELRRRPACGGSLGS
mgnify:CR=1 FL=1